MKDEHPPCAWRELGDRVLEIEEIAGSERHSDPSGQRVHSARLVVIVFEPCSLASFALSGVEHEVDRESVQPSRERALAAKEVQLFPCTNEDVLRQLLGALAVRDHSRTQSEDPIDVLPIQPL